MNQFTVSERRIDGHGQRLGPKPAWLARMSYDEKQLAGIVEPRLPKDPAQADEG